MAVACAKSSRRNAPASEQIGCCTMPQSFASSAASTSTITLWASRASSCGFQPDTARSMRAPTVSRKSEFCMAKLAPRGANIPGLPMPSAFSSPNKSMASHVAPTGRFNNCTSFWKSFSARARRTPLPTSRNGRSARLKAWMTLRTSPASSSAAGAGSGA